MGNRREVTIDESAEVVTVEIETANPDIYEFLAAQEDELREDNAEKALQVGAIALKSASTARDVELVKRRFEEMRDDFEGALDPTREASPISKLRRHLDGEFQEIRDVIIGKQSASEALRETPKRGEEFQDYVEGLLERVVSDGHGDQVERKTTEHGERTGRKVGDFVIRLGETGQNIVVEAKAEKIKSQPRIKRELEEAMENRDAAYGIFLVDRRAPLPGKIGWFQEFDRRQLVVALAEDDEDDFHPEHLAIAYKWAKMRAVQHHMERVSAEIDPEEIGAKVNEAKDSLYKIGEIRGECSNAEGAVEAIRKHLRDLESKLKAQLGAIEQELRME